MVPFRWGGLRRWEREGEPVDSFRREMDRLHREMDRLFDGFVTESGGPSWWSEMMGRGGAVTPQIDLSEDDKEFRVNVELPGLDQKDVDVTLTDRLLTVRGEKKEDKEQKEKNYYRRERAYGSFMRRIEIPSEVDAAKIEASFNKGVLTVRLPKSKEAQQKVKHIDVKAA
jgi:HSP20 family protein